MNDCYLRLEVKFITDKSFIVFINSNFFDSYVLTTHITMFKLQKLSNNSECFQRKPVNYNNKLDTFLIKLIESQLQISEYDRERNTYPEGSTHQYKLEIL